MTPRTGPPPARTSRCARSGLAPEPTSDDDCLGWVALALLIGVAGGAAIAVAAAARRTDTAYQRFLATSSPSDATITESKDFLTKDLDLDQVAALPEVERSAQASFLFFLGHTADGRPLSQIDFQPLAMSGGRWARRSTGGRCSRDAGSIPTGSTRRCSTTRPRARCTWASATSMTLQVHPPHHVRPADRVVPRRPARRGSRAPAPTARSTRCRSTTNPRSRSPSSAIVTDPVNFPPIPGQLEPFLRLTPAFTERYASGLTGNNVLFVDLADVTDLASFRSDAARLSGGASVFFGLTQADHEANVNRTLHLAAVVLWLLAGLIALGGAARGVPGPLAPGLLRLDRSSASCARSA